MCASRVARTGGYLPSADDVAAYIGAELLDVTCADTALNQKAADTAVDHGFDDGGIQCVDFNTSQGGIQCAAYNAHNGYYGHGVLIAKDIEVLLNTTLQGGVCAPSHL